MKFKNLILCVLTAATALMATTSCDGPDWQQPYLTISRQVSSDTISFDAFGGEAKILLEASREWKIDSIPAWLLIDPESGSAASEPTAVTITVPENAGFDRMAELIFKAGPMKEYICIYQKGPEGYDDGIIEITCADFCALPDDDGNKYRIKGSISGSINTTYGNFDVQDATGKVYVYGCTNLADYKDRIKSGYIITISGPKTTFNGKVELKNGTIESIEEGEAIRPTDITDISCADFANLTDTEGWYRLTGVVSGSVNTTYGNFDVKDATGSVYVYGVDNLSKYSTLAAGDSITVVGHYYLYTNKNNGSTKVEMMNGYIEWYKSKTNERPTNITDITATAFAALTDTETWYRLTGVVSGSVNTTYGNFDVTDATGSVYVYGCDNIKDYASTLAKGDSISVVGHYYLYTNASTGATKVEMSDGYIEWYKSNGGGGGGGTAAAPTAETVKKATIAEFNAAQEDGNTWYELTGVMQEIKQATYGNFDLKDETGSVYVYGLVKSYASSNDKSFSSLGLKQGDTLTLWTLRCTYNNAPEAGGDIPAVYVSHKANSGTISGMTSHPFTSNLTWTLGTKATKSNVVIEGGTYDAVKLGTSSLAGDFTTTVPSGKSKIGFYALGWTGVDGVLIVSGGGANQKFTIKKNAGCNNSSPFTISSLTDSDYYTVDFGAPLASDTTVTFTTESGGSRAIIFGLNAE